MVYSFARIGAALGMTVEDVYHAEPPAMGAAARERRQATRDAVPSQSREYLTAYLDGAGMRDDPKGPLFRTIGRGTGKLTRTVCHRRTPMR